MRRLLFVAVLAAVVPSTAQARIFVGAYGNTARFDALTGQRTDSGLTYLAWDQGRTWGSPYSYFLANLRERPHIALKTARNGGITPQGIAQGKGDPHLIGLATAIARSGKPTIIRPLAEMNNERNPYCAFARFVRRHSRVRFISFFNGPPAAPTTSAGSRAVARPTADSSFRCRASQSPCSACGSCSRPAASSSGRGRSQPGR